MTNKSKAIATIVIIVLLAGAIGLFFKGGDLFKGSLARIPRSSTGVSAIKTSNCDGKWTKAFAVTGTQENASVNFGSINDLFKKAENGCEFKVIRSKTLNVGKENIAIECDVISFNAYPLDPSDTSPAIKFFACSGAPVTEFMGVISNSGNIFDTKDKKGSVGSVGRDFQYSEYANGHGEVMYQWQETNVGKHIESLENADYTVFIR